MVSWNVLSQQHPLATGKVAPELHLLIPQSHGQSRSALRAPGIDLTCLL